MVDSSLQKPTSQSVPNLGAMGTYAVIPEYSTTSNGTKANLYVTHQNTHHSDIDYRITVGTCVCDKM